MKAIKPILIILNFSIYLVSIALWISIPEEATLNICTTLFALFFTIGLLLPERKKILKYAKSEFFKNLNSATINILLFFFLLGLLNYISFKNPLFLDLTLNKDNTLTEQSENIVKSMSKSNIHFKVFAEPQLAKLIANFLERYQIARNVKIQIIDPVLDPSQSKKYEITKNGEIVIEYNNRFKKVKFKTNQRSIETIDEPSITSSLVGLSRKNNPKLYLTSGHGELDLKSNANNGILTLSNLLKESFYDLETIDLTKNKISNNKADVLIILGPTHPFLNDEIKKIEDYLISGGNVFIAVDPQIVKKGRKHSLSPLLKIFEQFGIRFKNFVIIDSSSSVSGSNGSVPIVTRYNKAHSITADFSGPTFFPLVMPLEINRNVQDKYKTKVLGITNPYPQCWAKNNYNDISKSNFGYKSHDLQGPFAIALASSSKKGKIFAVGNSTFIGNVYYGQGRNFDFFLNSIAWLAEDNHLIAVNRPKRIEQKLYLSKPAKGIVIYFSVFFAPLILLAIAIYMFYRRR